MKKLMNYRTNPKKSWTEVASMLGCSASYACLIAKGNITEIKNYKIRDSLKQLLNIQSDEELDADLKN